MGVNSWFEQTYYADFDICSVVGVGRGHQTPDLDLRLQCWNKYDGVDGKDRKSKAKEYEGDPTGDLDDFRFASTEIFRAQLP
jgi:hypothetical protein